MSRMHSTSRFSSPGFDFTSQMRTLCNDLVARVPDLRHIDMGRVALAFCQTRKRVQHGLHASLTPMRFEGGRITTTRRGRDYTLQRLYDPDGCEMLYILSFYLPRFMETDFHEKLVTVVHELWHISPDFDGDLRRHEGRCYAHSHSQARYDAQVRQLVQQYVSLSPPEELHAFLRHSFRELHRRHGSVFGVKVPHPKLIPLG